MHYLQADAGAKSIHLLLRVGEGVPQGQARGVGAGKDTTVGAVALLGHRAAQIDFLPLVLVGLAKRGQYERVWGGREEGRGEGKKDERKKGEGV